MAYDSATGRPLSPDEEALRRRNASLVYGPPEVETIPADLTADDFLGGPDLDTTQEAAFDPGRFGGVIEGLAGLNTATRAPRNFGEGLIGGFSRGLGAAGTRVSEARQRFERGAAARQSARDEANRQATKDHRERLARQRERAPGEARAATEAAYKVAERTPGTPEYGASLQRISDEEGRRLAAKAAAPESPAERRAQANSDRAARDETRRIEAHERSNMIAGASTLNQFRDDYNKDKAISGYQGVRSNLNAAEAAAKLGNGVGDLQIVYAFQRGLEPENPNVVKEGEVDNARKAVGRLATIGNLPARFFKGDNFTEEGRRHFVNAMRSALKARRPDFDAANKQWTEGAKDFGVKPERFIRELQEAGSPGTGYAPGGFFDKNKPGGR